MSKAFFDTNVLLYSVDPDSPTKQAVACQLLLEHQADGTAVLSIQVLQELFNVAVGKFKVPPLAARSHVQDFMSLETVVPQPQIVLDAIDLVILHSLSIWDALILASAISAKCSVVYSEDMQDGFSVRGVTVRNPFAA